MASEHCLTLDIQKIHIFSTKNSICQKKKKAVTIIARLSLVIVNSEL